MTFRRIVISGVEETEHERRRDGTTLVRNRFTMISPGTEMSIYLGTNQNVMMRGAAGYPARIGYAAVGDVAEEPPADSGVARGDLLFHPSKHGDAACVDLADGFTLEGLLAGQDDQTGLGPIIFGRRHIQTTAP